MLHGAIPRPANFLLIMSLSRSQIPVCCTNLPHHPLHSDPNLCGCCGMLPQLSAESCCQVMGPLAFPRQFSLLWPLSSRGFCMTPMGINCFACSQDERFLTYFAWFLNHELLYSYTNLCFPVCVELSLALMVFLTFYWWEISAFCDLKRTGAPIT